MCLGLKGILEKGFSFYAVFSVHLREAKGEAKGGELAKVSLVIEYI